MIIEMVISVHMQLYRETAMTQEYENGTENDGSQIVLILISDSQMYY